MTHHQVIHSFGCRGHRIKQSCYYCHIYPPYIYEFTPGLLDYSSTKGAIVAFTRSLSMNLAEQGIRVNRVAHGPIWTPLIPSTFDEEHVSKFGIDTPMKRAGQPFEVAPAFVFLASGKASSYVSGQTIYINGGEMVNG